MRYRSLIEQYNLDKTVWTDADFDVMGWHDCNIYALTFNIGKYELLFDIDYIFKWVNPEGSDKFFKFWVAPATFIFENVYDFTMDTFDLKLIIDEINRDEPKPPKNKDFIKRDIEWSWTIELHSGNISFQSIGYRLYVRNPPILLSTQVIDMNTRGGISFAQASFV
jgi:hypothetical protein